MYNLDSLGFLKSNIVKQLNCNQRNQNTRSDHRTSFNMPLALARNFGNNSLFNNKEDEFSRLRNHTKQIFFKSFSNKEARFVKHLLCIFNWRLSRLQRGVTRPPQSSVAHASSNSIIEKRFINTFIIN